MRDGLLVHRAGRTMEDIALCRFRLFAQPDRPRLVRSGPATACGGQNDGGRAGEGALDRLVRLEQADRVGSGRLVSHAIFLVACLERTGNLTLSWSFLSLEMLPFDSGSFDVVRISFVNLGVPELSVAHPSRPERFH